MRQVIGPTMLGIGTVLVSSMFAVLKSLDQVDPIVRASWRLQTTFLALVGPSALSICLQSSDSKQEKSSIMPPMATIWSGCGYALYNVGLCIGLAKTSLLRASVLSQCAPLFLVLYKMVLKRCLGGSGGVHWKHILGVVLTLFGTGLFISSTTEAQESTEIKNEQLDTKSHILGDLAAAAASIGYATYISCGQQARKSVPVYIHLPGCVLVAMIIVSVVCFLATESPESLRGAANETISVGQSSDFCSGVFGWMCRQYLPRSVYLGVVCGAIAVGLINWSLNLVTALQAAAANSAEPIAASIIGILFFAEPIPNFVAILAAGIIILAMLLCSADDESTQNLVSDSSKTKGIASNTRKILRTVSVLQYVLLGGLCVLVLVEIFLIYNSEEFLPQVENEIFVT